MQFKNIFLAAAAAALSTAQELPTLQAALNTTKDLSALNTLIVQYPELAATLSDLRNTTIFAPSNAAFEKLMAMDGFEELAATEGYIQSLLMYHVVSAPILADNITTFPFFVPTTLQDSMYSNVTGGQVIGLVLTGEDNSTAQVISGLAQRSNITDADIKVDTGYVHIIDTVLTLPQNVSTTAIALNLTGLAGGLIYADLVNEIDTASDITVFAPTTDAFTEIASAFDNITPETLAAILAYHVVPDNRTYSSQFRNGTMLEAMDGNPLNVTIIDDEIFINSAQIVATDILVAGGVMHLIDSVLNVDSTNEPDADEDESPSNFEGATSGDIAVITSLVTVTATSIITAPTVVVVPTDTDAPGATSTEAGAATMPTGAMGAAALFGGIAILAQL